MFPPRSRVWVSGARRISAITTHGLFPGDALDRLQASGLFDRVIATDSHPRAVALAQARTDGFLGLMSVAGLFARYLGDHTP